MGVHLSLGGEEWGFISDYAQMNRDSLLGGFIADCYTGATLPVTGIVDRQHCCTGILSMTVSDCHSNFVYYTPNCRERRAIINQSPINASYNLAQSHIADMTTVSRKLTCLAKMSTLC